MVSIKYNDLVDIREKHKGKKIVFCSGSFDLVHAGHILFLEDCKDLGDILVVGIGDDETIRGYKGEGKPILNEHIRLKTVDSLKPVDYCFLDRSFEIGESKFFSSLNYIFENLKPDIYAINEDAFDIPGREELAKKNNVSFVVLKRKCPQEFENISTGKIIEKILKIDRT